MGAAEEEREEAEVAEDEGKIVEWVAGEGERR